MMLNSSSVVDSKKARSTLSEHDKNDKHERDNTQRGLNFSWVLEMCVLSVLQNGDAYGYELAQYNALDVSESTIYPVLRRLETKGYLETYTQLHSTRLRKIYSITPIGKEWLMYLKNKWNESVDAVNGLLYLEREKHQIAKMQPTGKG
jgi:PadR family transcriptional regulator PadR